MRQRVRYPMMPSAVRRERFEGRPLFELRFPRSPQHAERVNCLAGADQIDVWRAALFHHQAELHHRRHVERRHEALEADFQFLRRMAVEFYARVQIAR